MFFLNERDCIIQIFELAPTYTGCIGGVGRGKFLDSGIGSGGGHGGKGGPGCFNNSCIKGGVSYGNAEMPCELGSGSGNGSLGGSTAGGGIIGMFIKSTD